MFKFKVGDEIILTGVDGLKETVRGKIIYTKDGHCFLVCLQRTDIGWDFNPSLEIPERICNKYKGKKGWWISDLSDYGAKIARNLLEIE